MPDFRVTFLALALTGCFSVHGGENCPNPRHHCYVTGGPGCSDADCCVAICDVDPFCCDTQWDLLCVDQVQSGHFSECGKGPPINDFCDWSFPIVDGLTFYSTTWMTTDGPLIENCMQFLGDPQVSQDIWFDYQATQTGTILVSLCNSDFDTRLVVYETCACPVTSADELACSDDEPGCGHGLQSRVEAPVVQGQCYKIRVGGFGNAQGAGGIDLSFAPPRPPCDVTCPPAAIPEGEPCGGDTNGGCSDVTCSGPSGNCCTKHNFGGCDDPVCQDAICELDPFCCEVIWDVLCASAACEVETCQCDYSPTGPLLLVDCGDVICGTLWADSGSFDPDWFRFQTAGGRVMFNVKSSAPVQCHIRAAECPSDLLADSEGSCPDGVNAIATLPEGEYYLFVRADFNDGYPCPDEAIQYVATLSCAPGCLTDLDGDGGTDVDDLLLVIGAWGPCGVSCSTDLDGNGATDIDDLLSIINGWGPCPE